MIYTQLPSTYKDDTIAEALYAREVEYFHYEFDATNFAYLLAKVEAGPYRDQIQARLDSTLAQMRNVEHIVAALRSQITDRKSFSDAVQRATEKRKATPCATP